MVRIGTVVKNLMWVLFLFGGLSLCLAQTNMEHTGSATVSENFEDGVANGWVPGKSSRWDIVRDEGSKRYFLNTTEFLEDNGAMGEMSIYDKKRFGDFTFECDLKSADAAIGNSFPDLGIVYGYQNDRNYYYVMFNGEPNETAIYQLENGVRTRLDGYSGRTLEDGRYHSIKIIRKGTRVTVYYDSNKILDDSDATFGAGKIAVGSFNDSGYFDNIEISGVDTGPGPVDPKDLVVSEDFEDNVANDWDPGKGSRWDIVWNEGSRRYFLNTTEFLEDNGAMGEMSIYRKKEFADFTFECDLKSADAAVGNSFPDLDIVYGYQDSRNYYYVMFNGEPNETAIYQLENGIRTRLDGYSGRTLEDGRYHHIKIMRKGTRVTVYYDSKKILDDSDGTFGVGEIAVGSFNDSGYFDNIKISGDAREPGPDPGPGLYEVFENFEDNVAEDWVPGKGSRWDIVRDESSRRYFLNTTEFLADNGALGEMSIYRKKEFADFTFECDLKSEDAVRGNEFPDLDIVYGYQDSRNYYYVMFNGEPNETAIYQLENGIRTRLDGYSGRTLEDGRYHHIKIMRKGTRVTVYYDSKKILDDSDGTFGVGEIAVGSLNDSGYFDNIKIKGDAREPRPEPSGENIVSIPRGIKQVAGQTVEVPIYVTTGSRIAVAQFTVEYDGSVLKFMSASTGFDASGFSVTQQNINPTFPPTGAGVDKNVIVQISGGGSNFFSGTQQKVVLLYFKAVGEAGKETAIIIDKVCTHSFLTTSTLKDLCASAIDFKNGSFKIESAKASLDGDVSYLSSTRPVKNAVVELLSGTTTLTETTDNNGLFSFNSVQAGTYALRASKNGDLRNAVSGADVLTILQSLGFITTLSSEQKLAGDVNNSGAVTGSDAVAVLRYLAFLTDGTAGAGQWGFRTNSANVTINGRVTQNFDAWVKGDVTLNWGENNLMKSISGGDFVFSPTLEQEKMSIALVAGQSSGRVNTGTLSLDWVDDNQNNITFHPAGEGTHFAINNENGKTTHLSFANVRGFNKGEKIGTFVIAGAPGERANARIASLTNGTINDVAVPEKDILLGESHMAPDRFELFQNYPNPFNMQTAIKYAVPARDGSQKVSLKIFSIRGRLLRTLFEGAVEPGEHTANWDGTDDTGRTVSTGIYVVQFKSNSFSKSMKITVIK